MTKLDIDDIVFNNRIQDPFSDGSDLVTRLRQSDGRRFTVHEDQAGQRYIIRGRREVWCGFGNLAYALPMTPERAATLGPNPLEEAELAKRQGAAAQGPFATGAAGGKRP